ncbi:4-alpha-glucanotransferase [Phycicoccus sp. BSK3Z-2]|uniref:4-alpha-glucanotransferase n=1 Tax=Phycicoccus avicenniae TaxID=2828860 RepID=A0A941I073_9MICO|nr:4-alpha-glucanotransferase [Phycicoccus avicenniae]MBR7742986.1 4-alpha-glucanotransferase [Phycicoccus avicenniae]
MQPDAPTPRLAELAQAHGVATEYWDWQGRHVTVPADSVRAVLAALGVDAADEAAVETAITDHELGPWRHVLPPTVVTRAGRTHQVPVHVRAGSGVRLQVVLEGGGTRDVPQADRWVPDRVVDDVAVGEATFELPDDLPLGWHRLVADLDAAAPGSAPTEATLVVTPERLELPGESAQRRVVGLMAQLYQVRSSGSWGVGDLRDLADLASWAAAAHDADFVLVNPLHAAEPVVPMEASPYLPTTRRFVNPLYLRVEDVPETALLDASGQRHMADLDARGRALDAGERIDRDAAWTLKREALQLVFDAGRSAARAADFAAYCEREGEGLLRFATWCALADVHGLPFTDWPAELQDPDGDGVAAFVEKHADRVDLHRWMQWLLEEQLATAQREATTAGMSLGVVHDLAVGVHPVGADAWGLGDALARGVTVGAPPDPFNQLGQNWSQPPWRPDRLAEQGYAPFRDMIRTVLRDSGGIRVDHILGLFRLWWIPLGASPADGTYVYLDHEALIGILVLEAQRAGAVVIGEDLGVVAPNVREVLVERGLLGTSILWFEWDEDTPRPPESYRDLCLSTVTVHDLPPTAGYLTLEHVDVRDGLGLLTRPVEEEREVEQAAIGRVLEMVRDQGLLAADADVDEQVVALHRFLARTPSRMLAVALPDLVGDRRAINQPGTHEEYPNWRLPLAGPDGRPLDLDDVRESPLADALFAALRGD